MKMIYSKKIKCKCGIYFIKKSQNKRYCNKCSHKNNNRAKEKWRKSKKSRIYMKKYYINYSQIPKNKIKFKKNAKKWRESKKGMDYLKKYYKSNKRKKVMKKYYQSEYGRISNRIKRARLRDKKDLNLKSMPKLSYKDYKYILKLFNNKCFNCNKQNGYIKCKTRLFPILYIEHFYPVKKGYSLFYDKFNICMLCHSCNKKKMNKMPNEFYSREKLSKFKQIKNKWLKYKNAK